jgi:hypothetical protein
LHPNVDSDDGVQAAAVQIDLVAVQISSNVVKHTWVALFCIRILTVMMGYYSEAPVALFWILM